MSYYRRLQQERGRKHRQPGEQETPRTRPASEPERARAAALLDKAARAHRRLIAQGMDRHDAARIVRDSMPEPEPSEAERVAQLVRQGMDPLFIRPRPHRAPEREPEPDDWRAHPLACECLRCSATAPRYARPAS